MKNKLEEIFLFKQKEVEERQRSVTMGSLEASLLFKREPLSLKAKLSQNHRIPNVIAEFKRKSPSKGFINKAANAGKVVRGYEEAGAVGVSILTDVFFFGGCADDFIAGREAVPHTPLLRKEFIFDEYQLIESKSMGADVILLIAAMLDQKQIVLLSRAARNIGLEVLLEVHSKEELISSPLDCVDIIGVNNRDLKTFSVSVDTSVELSRFIPKSAVKISESGLDSLSVIYRLENECGYNGFLIGEAFMKTPNPEKALRDFLA